MSHTVLGWSLAWQRALGSLTHPEVPGTSPAQDGSGCRGDVGCRRHWGVQQGCGGCTRVMGGAGGMRGVQEGWGCREDEGAGEMWQVQEG